MTQTAVIGGVGPNIGAHTARQFAENGYDVGLFARSKEYLENLATEIRANSGMGDAIGVSVDLTNRQDVRTGFKRVHETFGATDVYIHNPNYTPKRGQSVIDVDCDSFRENWELKAKSLYHCTRTVLPTMQERGGTIIVTGSGYGRRAQGKYPAYESATMAARGFTRSVAKAHGDEGIHVSYVVIDGGVNPDDPEAIHPQQIAQQYLYLAEQDQSGWVNELELRAAGDTFLG